MRPIAGDDTTSRDRSIARRRGPSTRAPRRPHAGPAHGERFTPREPPDAQKLLIIIISDTDADGLVRAMVQRGLAATKIGSTGGFLRRGNTTLLVGVPASEVETVITLVGRTCPARTELLTLGALPFGGETPFISEPVEVRVGGAVIFVLNVERFERV
ncbi:MAG: hypothetical protein C4290_11310 [Chloroflexota bacterium]